MRVLRAAVRVVLGVGAVGCIALSCYFAAMFGWSRGSGFQTQLAFATLAAFLDLAKSGILIVTMDSKRAERVSATFAFIFLTAMSLWCAGGMTAVELAHRVSHKDVAATQQRAKQATLDRLTAQRKAMPEFAVATPEAVETAKAAVTMATEQAEAERGRGGCKDICRKREDAERDARAVLLKAQNGLAMTQEAAALEAKIDAAQKDLNTIDLTAATKQADPQSENMAKTFGVSEESIALIGHVIFAIGVEIGSGLLPWLLFGHGKREEGVTTEPASAGGAFAPAEPTPLVETPESVRERFFQEVMLPMPGQRVAATQVYNAYSRWCMEHSLEPMSTHAFGTKAPWEKSKMGGSIWYLSAQLAEAYTPQIRLAVSN